MSGPILSLPEELAAQMLVAAARAYPNEACGLIEGVGEPQGWRVLAVHETANLSENPERKFLLDPQVQFDLMRRLRGTGRRIIGCFHSHPDGVAEPSATDRADAYETDFLYLIAAGSPDFGLTLAAFVFTAENKFLPVEIRS